MAGVLLPTPAGGLTGGVRSYGARLGAAGHAVHTPDLFEGRVFDSVEEGVAHAQELGFATVLERGRSAAAGLPEALVTAGFSLGVMPAQLLAQTRPGVRGAVLMEAFAPISEFGTWPDGVPAQVHGMDDDPFFTHEGDLDAAREAAAGGAPVEVFTYPGSVHLFSDAGLPTYDAAATDLLLERVLAFLSRVG